MLRDKLRWFFTGLSRLAVRMLRFLGILIGMTLVVALGSWVIAAIFAVTPSNIADGTTVMSMDCSTIAAVTIRVEDAKQSNTELGEWGFGKSAHRSPTQDRQFATTTQLLHRKESICQGGGDGAWTFLWETLMAVIMVVVGFFVAWAWHFRPPQDNSA